MILSGNPRGIHRIESRQKEVKKIIFRGGDRFERIFNSYGKEL